jgi:hypothetical protein
MKPTRSLAKLLEPKGRVEAPKAPPREKQIFKCPQCANFFRLPTECKRCRLCPKCCVCNGPRVEDVGFTEEPAPEPEQAPAEPEAEPEQTKPKLPV